MAACSASRSCPSTPWTASPSTTPPPGADMAALSVDEAFAVCEARARAHYENFPVGLFVPKDKRPYVHALYAYARAADDFADEPMYEGMRAEKLDQWEARLHATYAGQAEDPIFVALGQT